MTKAQTSRFFCTLLCLCLLCSSLPALASSLPSWSDGPAKRQIMAFVKTVTDTASPDYVPPQERIAVFDNDGTLWIEQPVYIQLAFALDRVKEMASQHPEWKEKMPFKAVLENDMDALVASGKKGLLELVMASHANISTEKFAEIVTAWLQTAKSPKFHKPYTELVYKPMLELLQYLRDNGFKTYIVSGGGVEFMRTFSESVYGIPPEQVIGSSIKTKFVLKDGTPTLMRLPEIDFIDDKAGKPVGINQFIGRRPIAAFGNSDGDLQMLQWTTGGKGKRLGAIIHHTDAKREVAYDRNSHIGKLDKALDLASENGWVVVDMEQEWKTIFP